MYRRRIWTKFQLVYKQLEKVITTVRNSTQLDHPAMDTMWIHLVL